MSIFREKEHDKEMIKYLNVIELVTISKINKYYYRLTRRILKPIRKFFNKWSIPLIFLTGNCSGGCNNPIHANFCRITHKTNNIITIPRYKMIFNGDKDKIFIFKAEIWRRYHSIIKEYMDEYIPRKYPDYKDIIDDIYEQIMRYYDNSMILIRYMGVEAILDYQDATSYYLPHTKKFCKYEYYIKNNNKIMNLQKY